jgi:hypothetical protein
MENDDDSGWTCDKKWEEDEDGEVEENFSCDECEGTFCEDCVVAFDNSGAQICTSCIEDAYKKLPKRTAETKIVYQDRVVEKIVEKPIIQYVDKEGKEVGRQEVEQTKSKNLFSQLF